MVPLRGARGEEQQGTRDSELHLPYYRMKKKNHVQLLVFNFLHVFVVAIVALFNFLHMFAACGRVYVTVANYNIQHRVDILIRSVWETVRSSDLMWIRLLNFVTVANSNIKYGVDIFSFGEVIIILGSHDVCYVI